MHHSKITSCEQFRFGENWAHFLSLLSEERIQAAERSLQDRLDLEWLRGKPFIDGDSGSGPLSPAARRLGAEMVSFDFDFQSVDYAKELKDQFSNNGPQWRFVFRSDLDSYQ